MNKNLAIKQKLLEQIEFLSEDQMSSVLKFIQSLPNLTNNPEQQQQENYLFNQETNIDPAYKQWQPCNYYDAIEKLTNLLEEDKFKNNEQL